MSGYIKSSGLHGVGLTVSNLRLRKIRRLGSTTILFVVSLLLVGAVGFACVAMLMVVGGSRELQNSADAGALFIAKSSLMYPTQSVFNFSNPDVLNNFGYNACIPGDPSHIPGWQPPAPAAPPPPQNNPPGSGTNGSGTNPPGGSGSGQPMHNGGGSGGSGGGGHMPMPPGGFSGDPNPNPRNNPNQPQLNLLTYNPCAAQTMVVCMNAQTENTAASAGNARKTWDALNEVGQFLRQNLQKQDQFQKAYAASSAYNNVRMLVVGKSAKALTGKVGFIRSGAASNIAVPPNMQQTLSASGYQTATIGGQVFLPGYNPLTITLPANGDRLAIATLPCGPTTQPHLISNSELNKGLQDTNVSGKGSPVYPQNTLPPNAFQITPFINGNQPNAPAISATASSVIGTLNVQSQMQITNGFLNMQNLGYPQQNSTPWAMLQNAGAANSLIGPLTQRIQETNPAATQADVINGLSQQKLKQGKQSYLATTVQTGTGVVSGNPSMNAYAPAGALGSPDGTTQTFSSQNGTVTWTPSSGYNLLLGRLTFEPTGGY